MAIKYLSKTFLLDNAQISLLGIKLATIQLYTAQNGMYSEKCKFRSAGLELHCFTYMCQQYCYNGSAVAQCLTRDQRAAGSSLTGVTALCSLSKTHLS